MTRLEELTLKLADAALDPAEARELEVKKVHGKWLLWHMNSLPATLAP